MALVTDYATYTADSILAAAPQFVQDQDVANAIPGDPHGPFWHYVNLVGSILDQQVNIIVRDSIGVGAEGADGTVDDANYWGALGWSQVLDINRCPAYALPWLAQFVGVEIPYPNALTYQQQIDKITQRSGFNRGTSGILANAIAAIISSTEPNVLDPSRIIVMENTGYVDTTVAVSGNITQTAGTATVTTATPHGLKTGMIVTISGSAVSGFNLPNVRVTVTGVSTFTYPCATSGPSAGGVVNINEYVFDVDSITMLLPNEFFASQTYADLNPTPPGTTTYADLAAQYSNYAAFNISSSPLTDSNYASLIYRYRPAGIQVYIGGY